MYLVTNSWYSSEGFHEYEGCLWIREREHNSIENRVKRGFQRRKWDGNEERCKAFHANRRRCKSEYGRWLVRQRAAILERVFAHLMVTGGLRRIHLHGRENVQKRYLAHVFAYNLSVLMRAVSGMGSPRSSRGHKTLLRLLILGAVILLILKYLRGDYVYQEVSHHQKTTIVLTTDL